MDPAEARDGIMSHVSAALYPFQPCACSAAAVLLHLVSGVEAWPAGCLVSPARFAADCYSCCELFCFTISCHWGRQWAVPVAWELSDSRQCKCLLLPET